VTLALAWFALSPTAQAVTPAPDGSYPNSNTAEGFDALFSLSTGFSNTAIGSSVLYSDTTGSDNTGTGVGALFLNQTGSSNTANGVQALYHNNADNNTANGVHALFNNTTGTQNTATGLNALESNTTASNNTANGVSALQNNTTGNDNTANGVGALQNNTTGGNNTANGEDALFFNTTGNDNTANGVFVLLHNTTGSLNTANGFQALLNSTGSNNIALGSSAGINLTNGSNNIDIGNAGVAGESSTIRVGTKGTHTNTFIAGINGVTVAGGVGVIIDANGHLGTKTSSARFKEAIKPMDKASEAILALQPVTFRYKHELDPEGVPQFGLVAEQVEKVNPDLVARDEQGEVYTVRYEAVNAMLLNEFLKEHSKVQEQEKTIAELKSGMETLTATLKEQASQIQKVSAEVELNKAAPQMVADNQ
jgi:hypothetical protein